MDELTDVSRDVKLGVFVSYSYEVEMYEDMLFCTSLEDWTVKCTSWKSVSEFRGQEKD